MTIANAIAIIAVCGSFLLITAGYRHEGMRRAMHRVSISLFDQGESYTGDRHDERRRRLHRARFGCSYREYRAFTYFVASVAAIAGGVGTIYAINGVFVLVDVTTAELGAALPGSVSVVASIVDVRGTSIQMLVLSMFLSVATVGALIGVSVVKLRWWYPAYVGSNRRMRIDATLPYLVAFMYALSRSGMEIQKIVRIIADNEDSYGEVSREYAAVTRNVDLFGLDVVSAVKQMAHRTPSDQFKEFNENLANVLVSGHDLSTFLEREYERFQQEAETQQESILEQLRTLAEAYVTVLVAGPLFLITILVVIGYAVRNTIEPLSVLIYVILPLGNLLFIVYLSMATEGMNPDGQFGTTSVDRSMPKTHAMTTDGGVNTDESLAKQITTYRRIRSISERISSPVEKLFERPIRVAYLTVPLVVTALAITHYRQLTGGTASVEAVADSIVVAMIFVLGSFAFVYEVQRRRNREIERALPDFLDRFANVNRAGGSLISSFDRVRRTDLDALGREVRLIWADIELGATLESALSRFSHRNPTPRIRRAMTVVSESMKASNDISPVLEIVAHQTDVDRRLKRERRQSMMEYLVVVYLSFLVFLFIIAVLAVYLLPSLSGDGFETTSQMMDFGAFGDGDIADAYLLLFYHAAVIQGCFSGLIAGQLAGGRISAGAKHATAMMIVAYLLFAIM